MRLKAILLLVLFTGILYSQNKNIGKVWIKESYIKSIDIKGDTLKEIDYLLPIIGFSNVFTKTIGIMGYHGDEITSKAIITKINGEKTVVINNIDGWLGYYLIKKGISDTLNFVGYLTMKNEKLLLQIWSTHKLVDEFYYVNHYKDYYFENLRDSHSYLYNLKYK